MEYIRFGNTQFELPTNGYQMRESGGKIAFKSGTMEFLEIEAMMKETRTITMLDSAGAAILTRSDLVYAGRLMKDDTYIIGAEQTGADEEGHPIMQDVIGTVIIAEFRTPGVQERLDEVDAKVDYVAMMAGVEMEV